MKNVHLCAAMALACVAFAAGPAFAAAVSDTNVSIPYGDVAASAVNLIGDAAWIAIVGVLGTFAPGALSFMRIARFNQVAEKALKGVFEKYADDLRGKSVTVDLKNRMVADAARSVVTQAPGWLVRWAGADSIPDKLLARWTDALDDWLKKQKA